MRKRLRKKIHKFELYGGIADLSQMSFWRHRLFTAATYQTFPIDAQHLEGVSPRLAGVIRARDLRFEAARVDPAEAPFWLSEGGSIIFRFRPVAFPSLTLYSGNNPAVV